VGLANCKESGEIRERFPTHGAVSCSNVDGTGNALWRGMTTTKLCDCGQPSHYHPLVGFQIIDLCADCYGLEFPERMATFELVRRDPRAGEFSDL
jgi:hypothetical protein